MNGSGEAWLHLSLPSCARDLTSDHSSLVCEMGLLLLLSPGSLSIKWECVCKCLDVEKVTQTEASYRDLSSVF